MSDEIASQSHPPKAEHTEREETDNEHPDLRETQDFAASLGTSLTLDGSLPGGSPPGSSPTHRGAQVSKVGRFEVVRKLGEGAFAEVYLARDPALGRQVALKLMKPTHLASKFLEEARKAVKLEEHPRVVRVLDAGTSEEGRNFVVSE